MMKSIIINILISVGVGLVFFGLPILFSDTKTKLYAFGIGVTILFWVWFHSYIGNVTQHKKKTKIESSSQIEEVESTKTKTLHELFLSDFDRTHMLGEYNLTKDKNIVYTVEYIIWGDFDTKTLFFSIFFPKSDYTFDAIIFLAPKYNEILNGNVRSLMEGMVYHAPGEKEERWSELSFSGRIYIYHETPLLDDRIAIITSDYKKFKLHPQFRSKEYLIMRNSPLYEK